MTNPGLSELACVEGPIVRELRRAGHDVLQQVVCGKGRADIFDETTSEIIECKARGDLVSLAAAAEQLARYRPHFFDPQLAIAVPVVNADARWLAEALEKRGIRIIEVEKGIGV